MPSALLIATTLSFCNVYSSTLSNLVQKYLNRTTSKEKTLLDEKAQLKSEQNQLNMVDNFAKYSKIQRRINLIDNQLRQSQEEKGSLVTQLLLKYGFKFILWLILLVFSYYYKSTPVFQLDKSIDLTPFSTIITYPNGDNYVSFHFWHICCCVILRIIKDI